jgi:AcrR family transcriptional regulator
VSANGSRGEYAKSAARRQEIVAAAVTEFATRGYHGGSLRQVARELDLSVTSVTHLFGSKAQLLEAVLERTDAIGEDFLDGRRRAGLPFASAVVELIERNQQYPELLRLLAVVSAEASAADHPAHGWFNRRYISIETILARWIRDDQDAGLISAERDPGALARLTIATWDGLQLQWLLNPSRDMAGDMRRFLAGALHVTPAVGGLASTPET